MSFIMVCSYICVTILCSRVLTSLAALSCPLPHQLVPLLSPVSPLLLSCYKHSIVVFNFPPSSDVSLPSPDPLSSFVT